MSGNREGGLKAYQTIIKKDPNHMAKIGSKGGKKGGGQDGFAHGKYDPREAGRRGGSAPRKRKEANNA